MFFWRSRNRDGDALPSEWGKLVKALGKRLYRPIFKPAYVFFFAVSMLLGATGIWVAIAEAWLTTRSQTPPLPIWEEPSVFKSILTYFAALGSLSCIQVIVVEDRQKSLRSLLCLILIAFIFLAILAALNEYHSPGAGFPYLATGTVLAIVTWWIANWDEKKYSQHSSLNALGGDSDESPAGGTEGFSL